MSARALDGAFAAIFEPAVDEHQWWEAVLTSLVKPMRATFGLAYAWRQLPEVPERLSTVGDEAAAAALSTAIFPLPWRSFLALHRPRSGVGRLERQLPLLPAELRTGLVEALDTESVRTTEVFVLAPRATKRQGIGLLLGTPRASIPGPRARATLQQFVMHLSTVLALNQVLAREGIEDRRRTPALVEHRLWREVFEGKWAVLRTERGEGANRMLLVRIRRAQGVDPRALSARECHVLELTLEGRANKWIGWRLGLATATVASHLRTGIAKLGLRSRSELFSFFGAVGPE